MMLESHIREMGLGISESNARSIFYKILEIAPQLNEYRELQGLILQVSANTFSEGYHQALEDLKCGKLRLTQPILQDVDYIAPQWEITLNE